MFETARPEDLGLSSDRLTNISRWMRRYVEAGKLPGAMTLVARHGKVAYLECQGHRDLEAGLPVEEDTIFRFYSMTKPITSVGIMMLFEEGAFQLEDPLHKFIPEFANMRVWVSGEGDAMTTVPAKSPITMKQLLTHTSGLTYGFMESTPVDAAYRANRIEFNAGKGTLEDTARRLAEMPLLAEPGTEWNYSVSTDVLGRVIEVISGQTLDDYFRQRILEPLGMKDTGFTVPEGQAGRFAALYVPTPDGGMELADAPATSHYVTGVTNLSGGGGLVSTMGDYFRFTEMLRRGGELDGTRLLGRKTLQYMRMNHLPGDMASMGQPRFSEVSYEGIGFGLGFSVVIDPARAQVLASPGEYAWGGAASTVFWLDPVEDMTVIFLTQLRPSSTYPLRPELRALTYQALID